jgi:dihydroorotate dehydrogenase
VTTSAFGAFSAISIYKGNEKFFDSIVMPVVHTLNPETSHKIAIVASKYGLFSRSSYEDPVTLVRHSLVSLMPFNKLPQLVGIKQGYRLKNESIVAICYTVL